MERQTQAQQKFGNHKHIVMQVSQNERQKKVWWSHKSSNDLCFNLLIVFLFSHSKNVKITFDDALKAILFPSSLSWHSLQPALFLSCSLAFCLSFVVVVVVFFGLHPVFFAFAIVVGLLLLLVNCLVRAAVHPVCPLLSTRMAFLLSSL